MKETPLGQESGLLAGTIVNSYNYRSISKVKINFEQLTAFAETVDRGSFSAAARAMGGDAKKNG